MTQTKTHTNEKETKMTTSPIRMQQRPMEEDLNPNRRTAVLVGALFLISTATFIFSNALITPLLGSPNFLAAVADHSQLMIAATLIGLIGYAALLLAALLDMLGLIDLVAGPGLVWLVPGGLFELLLPIWLFARGFNLTASLESRLAR